MCAQGFCGAMATVPSLLGMGTLHKTRLAQLASTSSTWPKSSVCLFLSFFSFLLSRNKNLRTFYGIINKENKDCFLALVLFYFMGEFTYA